MNNEKFPFWHYSSLTKFRWCILEEANECNMQTDLQIVIHFHTHLHGFLERGSSHGKNHKLLHIHINQKLIMHSLSLTHPHNNSSLRNHACIASLFPACDPPLMTLKAGTGKTNFLLPARFAICCTETIVIKKSDTKKQPKTSTQSEAHKKTVVS